MCSVRVSNVVVLENTHNTIQNKLANDLDNDDACGGPPSPKRRTFGGDKSRYSNVQRHYDRHALRSARLSKDEAFEQRRNGTKYTSQHSRRKKNPHKMVCWICCSKLTLVAY